MAGCAESLTDVMHCMCMFGRNRETTPVVAEGGDAPAAEEPVVVKKEEVAALDPMTALKEVLTNALISDGLKRGLHEYVWT